MFAPPTHEALTDDQLTDALCEQAAHVHAATCRLLELIGEFDRRRGWDRDGCLSCAHFLSWRCGIALRTAHEHVRVALRLSELPLVHAAFARGQLSYSKVRVLARMAKPATEADLVANALDATAAQLETVGRLYRRSTALSASADGEERRHLRYWWDDDGALVVQARLDGDDGARFVATIEALTPAPERGVVDDIEQRRADALAAMASGPAPATEVVVHVDAAVLAGAATDGTCHVEGAVGLTAHVARRLACDSGIRLALDGPDGDPLDVGRRTRAVSGALRRALRARDRGCQFPGCTNDRWVDAHHVRHWAQGGSTALANLVVLCRRHHRLVHEGGFRLEPDDGGGGGDDGNDCGGRGRRRFRVLDRRGREVTVAPTGRPASGPPIEERHVAAALGIGPATAAARAGPLDNRPDYDLWISALLGAETVALGRRTEAAA